MKKSGRYTTTGLAEDQKEEYFAAVRQGMARDYQPMEKVFNAVIARTLQGYEEK